MCVDASAGVGFMVTLTMLKKNFMFTSERVM